MATVQDVFGFREVVIGGLTDGLVKQFSTNLNAACVDRGIAPQVPSDALDMSRDLIIDEAVQALPRVVGQSTTTWMIKDGITLLIAMDGMTLDGLQAAAADL